jgi:cell division protein FtsN
MTYSDRSRDDERRRQEEKRKADERRRIQQRRKDDERRRAELAKQAQEKKKQQAPKSTTPQQSSNLPTVNPNSVDPRPQPQPKKEASFWDRAAKFGGRVVDGAKNFGSGFVWQFAENQVTTTASDVVNPKAGATVYT